MVYCLSGKFTIANIDTNIDIAGQINLEKGVDSGVVPGRSLLDHVAPILPWLPWLLTFFSLVYARGIERLRKDTIERLHGRIAELEHKFDVDRSSSKLTSRGETNHADL